MLILSRPSITASARPPNHAEVVARFWRRVWVDCVHELLENNKRRQAADPSAIERE